MKRVIHVVPDNVTPCGGMKVHFQLAELERELGYESYVAFPKGPCPISWRRLPEHSISYVDARELCNDDTLVVGWEDPDTLDAFPTPHKVCYIQGHIYFQQDRSYEGIDLWFNSNWCKMHTKRKGILITPFLDAPFLSTELNIQNRAKLFPSNPSEWRVLVMKRKHGEARWKQVEMYLPFRPQVTFMDDTTETGFAEQLLSNHFVFASAYPEGLGLVPMEAMALGTIPFGYTGGGGKEYMVNKENSLFANDGDFQQAARQLSSFAFEATGDSIEALRQHLILPMLLNGLSTAQRYNKSVTREQLSKALEEVWKTDGIL